jgi:hypothetical protein
MCYVSFVVHYMCVSFVVREKLFKFLAPSSTYMKAKRR